MAGHEHCCEATFWLYLLIIIGLVTFAGLMSGLTLGLMSLGLVDLEVLVKSGRPSDRKHAAKILPVVKNQHLLLCTLLIGNSLAMEALPIFLDSLLPSLGAILISVTLILIFGEILPQAVCSRYGLKVGATMAPVVRLLLLIFFPITYPISKMLDWLLGKGHFVLLRRAELKTLVDMHGNEAGKGGELTHDETTIITGALEMTQKTAKDAMTAICATFSVDVNAKLDMYTMNLIMTNGHSRVPVYSGVPTNIIGLILVKNLIKYRPEDETPIRNVTIRKIPRVPEHMPLYDILNEFQKGHSHMAVVVKRTKDRVETPDKGKELNSLEEKKMTSTGQKGRSNSKAIAGLGNPNSVSVDKGDRLNVGTLTSNLPFVQNHATGSSQGGRGGERISTAPRSKKWERTGLVNILEIGPEFLPSFPADEEVVGIITMEDVMEELLQEEILDETDEYVDVHHKIKINMLPPGRRSPLSPLSSLSPTAGATLLSPLQWRSPLASPLLSHYHTPIMRSPTSPCLEGLGPTPAVLVSPSISKQCSPARKFLHGSGSPNIQQESGLSHGQHVPYEKLGKLNNFNNFLGTHH